MTVPRDPHPASRSLSSGRPKAGPVGSATLLEDGEGWKYQ